MKIFKITYRFAVSASVMLLAFSCNQNELDLPSSTVSLRLGGISDVESPLTRSGETVFQERLGEDLWFTATVSDNPVSTDVLTTKGTNTKEADFATLYGANGFNVYAENQSNPSECLFNNEIFKFNGTEWVPMTSTNWPAYVSDWYCWAPDSIAALSQSNKTFTYTTPASNTSSDKDILVSTVKDVAPSKNSTLDITFKHALCEVKFVSNSRIPAGTLDSLCINGINLTGTYDFDSGTWKSQTTPGSISLKTSLAVTAGTAGQALTDSTQTFFVIPQTVGTGASLSVKYNGGTKHVIDLPSGFDFPAGKLVTFSLGEADFTFVLNDPGDNVQTFEDANNVSKEITHSISVKSIMSTDVDEYADWEIQSYQIGTNPAVSVNDEEFKAGGYIVTKDDDGTLSVTSEIRTTESWGDHAHWTTPSLTGDTDGSGWSPLDWSGGRQMFRDGNEYGTTANPIDLSRYNYHQENYFDISGSPRPYYSANTYIIRHAGTYMLPLVYGNSIHDGHANPDSFISSTLYSGDNILTPFVNSLGRNITNCFIENDSDCIANSADIIWQQNNNVISNLQIVGSTLNKGETYGLVTDAANNLIQVRYLKFTVNQNTICQNNGLICIRDEDGNVIWSWHIWITNDPALINEHPNFVTNKNNCGYGFFPLNTLGWTEDSLCPARDRVKIVLIQKESGKQIQIDVDSPQVDFAGSCTYYQYGRKDPMFVGMYTINKGQASTIGEAISNPATFYASSSYDWCHDTYNNLWTITCDAADSSPQDQDANKKEMIKTIYDPSPVGYKVPAPNAYLNFDDKNNQKAHDNFGWEFSSIKSTIYFPASGFIRGDGTFERISSDKIDRIGIYGTLGLASKGSDDGKAYFFNIGENAVAANSLEYRSIGAAMRPVIDETEFSVVNLY